MIPSSVNMKHGGVSLGKLSPFLPIITRRAVHAVTLFVELIELVEDSLEFGSVSDSESVSVSVSCVSVSCSLSFAAGINSAANADICLPVLSDFTDPPPTGQLLVFLLLFD